MIITIKTALGHILPMLPIVGAGVIEQDGNLTKISSMGIFSRIIELALLGTIFIYTTVQVLDSKIEHIEAYLEKHEEKCDATNDELHELHTSILLLRQQSLHQHMQKTDSDDKLNELFN